MLTEYGNLIKLVYMHDICAKDLNIVAEPDSNVYRNIRCVPLIVMNPSQSKEATAKL